MKSTTLILCCAVLSIAAEAETAEAQEVTVYMKADSSGDVLTRDEGPDGGPFGDFLVCDKTYFGLFTEGATTVPGGGGSPRPFADAFTCRAAIGPSTALLTGAFRDGNQVNLEVVVVAPTGGPGGGGPISILELNLQEAVVQRVRVSSGGDGIPVVQYEFQYLRFSLRTFGGPEVSYDFERAAPF